MRSEEIVEDVMDRINDLCTHLSLAEYLDVLQEINDNISQRIEAVEFDIKNQEEQDA